MKRFELLFMLLVFLIPLSCGKDDVTVESESFELTEVRIDGENVLSRQYKDVDPKVPISLLFSGPVDKSTVASNIEILTDSGSQISLSFSYEDRDCLVKVQPVSELRTFSTYKLNVWPSLKTEKGTVLSSGWTIDLLTGMDMRDKFERIPDDVLMDKVQQQTLRYFWDLGHPVSGMARERSTSSDIVTIGGTGFGIMAMIVGAERKMIDRDDVVERIQKIVTFLKENCTSYHGAYAHWLNGTTGITVKFSDKDNGADLVETSFLFQGLLTARQYFKNQTIEEKQLRQDITELWKAVDWNWFRKNGENRLYWHWSPEFGWEMNMPIGGWNECLITYILAASSPVSPISKEVYTEGWAHNGEIRNGNVYYDYILPLGNANGGPLFFTHYSFLGLNPKGLHDSFADYWTQNKNHALINYNYCVHNPKGYVGYSENCWGLTASDGDKGYSAHSPDNDLGVIAPTAALASMPYTPEQSMQALHYFYYKLGDKLWKEYGFVDAFNLSTKWFDNQFLAVDQGPIVVMLENYRSGLLWKLFMSCPDIQKGLDRLGFQYMIP
ncbi:glucoamylase family protein [Parabacteroides sp.]|uniref:glucoamylase family protein n=1 Tax=Parabacteroides sp. TaxID=1869337 RepID=UPI003080BFCF